MPWNLFLHFQQKNWLSAAIHILHSRRESRNSATGKTDRDFTKKYRSISFFLIKMNNEKQKQSGGKDEQFRLFVLFVLRKAL